MIQSLPSAAREHYRKRQQVTAAALLAVRRSWSRMGDDLDASWRQVAPELLLLVTAAQLQAASQSEAYVAAVAAEAGVDGDPAGAVRPRVFAGAASDGRPLLDLLFLPVIRTKVAIGRDGGDLASGLRAGGALLDLFTRTQVADAGRAAESVAMVARPRLRGYRRMLNPPSCSRCAVLAGKWFGWNQGFRRHPGCDCLHVPAASAESSRASAVSPRGYFNSLTAQAQDDHFGVAASQAIRDGADIGKVVNASATTSTAAGRRAPRPGARPRPEQIYDEANGDRERAILALRDAGYLT